MSILVVGLNHKSAPVSIREKVAFSPEQLIQALQSEQTNNTSNNDPQNNSIDKQIGPKIRSHHEKIILSTCNRTEIYTTDSMTFDDVCQWLAAQHNLSEDELRTYLYTHKDGNAIQHVLRVASGLDSMVLGEPQILGQLKSALRVATECNSTGTTLKKLMQHAFSTAKKVRTETSIGANPVSVAFAAVNLARQIFSKLENKTALLIGAGQTIELVGRHLHSAGIGKVIIANRSVEKAAKLAKEFKGIGITLQEIGDYLPEADIVISSTAAPVPVIGKGTVEWALKKRKHRPIFMVDIAVPRDIEPEVAELDDVYLYTVDDLQSVIEENMKSREHAAEQAEAMIVEEVESFKDWLRAQDKMQLIRNYREKIETIKQETLQKTLSFLKNGKTPNEAIEFLAHTLTNKLAHDATAAMNKAAHKGDHKFLEASSRLLNLSDEPPHETSDNKDKTTRNKQVT